MAAHDSSLSPAYLPYFLLLLLLLLLLLPLPLLQALEKLQACPFLTIRNGRVHALSLRTALKSRSPAFLTLAHLI